MPAKTPTIDRVPVCLVFQLGLVFEMHCVSQQSAMLPCGCVALLLSFCIARVIARLAFSVSVVGRWVAAYLRTQHDFRQKLDQNAIGFFSTQLDHQRCFSLWEPSTPTGDRITDLNLYNPICSKQSISIMSSLKVQKIDCVPFETKWNKVVASIWTTGFFFIPLTCHCMRSANLPTIVREKINGNVGYYNINTHLNPTNVCVYRCRFCAFRSDLRDPKGLRDER